MNKPLYLMRLRQDIDDIRNKRTQQFVIVAILMLSLLAVINALTQQSAILYTQVACISVLSMSLFMLRKGFTQAGAYFVVLILVLVISQAMWTGSGLRSSAVLGLPGVLLLCLIMVNKRIFYILWALMVAYMFVLSWATINGYREGTEQIQGYYTLVDYVLIFSTVTFVIRVLGTDLLNLLGRLRMEMHDVNESKLEAEHLANHDNLTGLPNRRMAEHYFVEMLENSKKEKAGVALVFVDVDNFKFINDSHGHQHGDDLLKHLGDTISGELRRSDRLVRIAGDEFLILLPGVDKERDVENILDKINQSVHKPVTIDGETLFPALSMGIALAPAQGEDFRKLMICADKAMYKAKADGRNRYYFYSASA
jgi:diguanylate cyclase (GGDEF)-like protein